LTVEHEKYFNRRNVNEEVEDMTEIASEKNAYRKITTIGIQGGSVQKIVHGRAMHGR
jgi:hypothetical protein